MALHRKGPGDPLVAGGGSEPTTSAAAAGGGGGRETELETLLLNKVGEVSSVIEGAERVEDVICAVHSLAAFLFPVNSQLLSGVLDGGYKAKVLSIKIPTDVERESWKRGFYGGAAFPTIARILLHDVASGWLACFPLTARIQVYDSFFVEGPPAETIQALVPCLTRKGSDEDADSNAICSNAERLLVLCLFGNGGVYVMAREFREACINEKYAYGFIKPNDPSSISGMAQMLTSIPDKAGQESPAALSAPLFFKQVTIQLLNIAEDRAIELFNRKGNLDETIEDGTFSFIGETFARICRRGSAGILLSITIARVLDNVRSCISSSLGCSVQNLIESDPKSVFWLNLMEHVKDPYAVERLSEELLRQLAKKDVSDEEAYWVLWILFHRTFKHQTAIRVMFTEKFLLLKVFPVCCLKWILHFSVFERPQFAGSERVKNTRHFLDTVHHLLSVWSKREFVQSAPTEKQAYITAAVGLCVERMSKEELEATKDALNSILQGVSCRLESPIDLVRKMASSVAFVFSKVVDPNNPLYLDECCGEPIDWEFGVISTKKGISPVHHKNKVTNGESSSSREIVGDSDHKSQKKVKNNQMNKDSKFSALRVVDPDEVIDPASINNQELEDEENDDESEISETSDDSSLQPYDMSDDDTDLKKNFSQLVDIIAALRKTDEPDGVEQALDIAEKFIRASPDELQHNAGDLVRTLVQIRCSDLTIEGEEESAEAKRQKALVALLVTCPFESVDMITRLLYSSNMDVSQRILVIDVMTEAAEELTETKTYKVKYQKTNLISTISDTQPWFIPSSRGPEGSSPWEEVTEMETPLSWSQRFERTLPSRPGQVKAGKSRRWSIRTTNPEGNQLEWTKNRFPLYAAAFMLPAMQGFDKREHGVDFLGRDFIVLGKLIHMLGVCMRCLSMHPEASALAPALLDMLSSRDVSHHSEAYVRRSVLFAASSILVALHPSFVASALIEGNQDISKGLEWIRSWALHVAETDPDTESTSMAVVCLQLHAEMALQTSRSLESAECFKAKTGILPATSKNDIVLPIPKNIEF